MHANGHEPVEGESSAAVAEPASPVNAERTRAIANRINDLFLPVYPVEGTASDFEVHHADERIDLDKAFSESRQEWAPLTEDDAVRDVYAQFCRLMPKLSMVSLGHEPSAAEFHWSKVRCVLGGAGFALHPVFAKILSDLYPLCPLKTDESREEWDRHLAEAHRKCGWPIGLGLVNWSAVCYATPQAPKDAMMPLWVKVAALFHILKHLRFSKTFGLVTTYKNTCAFAFDEAASNILGTSRFVRVNLVPVLGCPSASDKKSAHLMTVSVEAWLRVLSTADLLRRKSTASLPGVVQHGPWSTMVADPMNKTGFVQHGSRLNGVWLAQNGKVFDTPGETADIVGYDWSLTPDDFSVQRTLFEAAIPPTYDTYATPFDVLQWGFPNINTANFGGPKTAACLFDAVLCAALMAQEVPSLRIEKPIVLCMPSVPTLDDSTNQGKSKAAHSIARALVPGIPLIGVSDSDSAPDQRTIASMVRRYGTICADEWRQPKRKNHILSHENLQLLITGGAVAIGEVLSNDTEPLSLQHPIVASCKAMDVPPDIINRALILTFDQLTDAQRARPGVLDEIESGKMSLRMRLAALAMCESMDLAARVNAADKPSTTKGWRFNTLRTIARMIWHARHGTDGGAELDTAIQSMQSAIVGHTREAEENGLLATLEEGTTVKVRVYSLFHEMTAVELNLLIASCDGRSEKGAWSATTVLRARAELVGLGGRPLSILCEHLSGVRVRASDRSVATALARDIRGVLPNVGDEWLLPELLGMAGWRLVRLPDIAGAPRVTLVRRLDRSSE